MEQKKGKRVRHPKGRSWFSKTVSRLVTHKPWPIILICLIGLGSLAVIFPRIDFTYGVLDSFPEDMPSREGFAIISDHYPPGEIAPVQLIIDTEGQQIELAEELAAIPAVEKVSEPAEGEENPDIRQYTITLAVDPYTREAVNQIPELRQTAVAALDQSGIENAGERIWLVGQTANLYDTEQVTSRD